MIVDDEPIICQGLRQTVPWSELQTEVVAEAYDGEEALEKLQENQVDILLTDVKMPVMDGLELSEKIHQYYPDIRIIIISGYDEFEYAKRAMRQGVKDYLLKPVDIEELMRLIESIRLEMDEQIKKEWQYSLKQLLSSAALGDEMDIENKTIKRTVEDGYCFFVSEIMGYAEVILPLSEDEQHQFKRSWMEHLEKSLLSQNVYGVSIFTDENRLLTCCKLTNSNESFLQIFKRSLANVEKRLNVSFKGCISPGSCSLMELRHLYQLVNKGMKRAPMINETVFKSEKLPSDGESKTYPKSYEKRLKEAEEVTQIKEAVEGLFEHFQDEQWMLDDVVAALRVLELNLFVELLESFHQRLQEEINITVYNSYQQIEQLFYQDLKDYAATKKAAAEGSQSWLIKKAVTYIEDHFSQDLKAAEIADVINVSPNYFSQLIKHETGQHFNEFLHDIRIAHAKQLLKETPYRVFEIAEMVGYKDYKYFVQIFKRKADLTPTQYRNISIPPTPTISDNKNN